MVTSSPLPTCNSPSQLVSMEAGLKSSGNKKETRIMTIAYVGLSLVHTVT